MKDTVPATEVRIHFGEIMRRTKDGPITVERRGKPEVVILSKQAYDRLVAGETTQPWQELVTEARERVAAELQGRPLPPPEEIIRRGREARDAQIKDALH